MATESNLGKDTQKAVRVLVVDDSPLARQALGSVVDATDTFTLAGCVDSGERALALLPRVRPNLVLLDVWMPGLTGAQTARQMLKASPGVVVVLVSAQTEELPTIAASCGADGSVPKGELSPRRLTELWSQTQAQRARATRARRVAHERVEEARALHAQAAHQARRAAINSPLPKHGQTVWVDGREARFFTLDADAAVIRYHDEPRARVVPYEKITLTPPRGQ